MKYSALIVKYRRWISMIPIALSLGMLIPLRQAQINPDMRAYLPYGIEAKVNMERMEEVFGRDDAIIIFLESDDILNPATLSRVQVLSDAYGEMPQFSDVISLSTGKYIRGEGGSILVDPIIKGIPRNRDQRELLRSRIMDNPLAYKMLVSDDFRFTLMMLRLGEVTDAEAFRQVKKTLTEHPGNEKVYFAGNPYLRLEIQQKATRDLLILLPAGLLVMMVFLYLSFREAKGVWLPLAVVGMSILLAMGLMPILGYELSLIAVLVPILMIAVANNYGVHLIARYQELNATQPGLTMKEIALQSVDLLSKPVILTALTTIVGILGMIAQVMIPARQMGIVSAAGVAFALVLSLLFVPAVMMNLKKGRAQRSYTHEKSSVVDHFLTWAGKISTNKPLFVIMAFALVLAISASGIVRLKVGINNERMLPGSHPLRTAVDISNKEFGGIHTLSLLFEGDIMNPEVMETIDRFETTLREIPEVGNVISVATVVRAMSRALNDPGEPWYDKIPDTRDAIAQYFELYNMGGTSGDFDRLVDFAYSKATVNIQFRAEDMTVLNRVLQRIEMLKESSEYCIMEAGNCLLQKEFAESIVKGQFWSLILALFAIVVLLWAIFRSLSAGLLGSIPLVFSVLCTFGLMGWVGFDLDIANSLISSIAIGIGVDYTIHIFWRIRTELNAGRNLPTAIKHALSTTGRGITINAFSVMIGFSVLFLSALVLLKSFAFLIIFSLLLCLLCALILVPSVCTLLKPGFLYNNNHNKTE